MITIFAAFSCEDRYYKEKFDIQYSIINKTGTTIKEIKVEALYDLKTWVFKDVAPGKTETLTFNIKRDLRTSEGSIVLTSYLNDTDSVSLATAYFTNWSYQAANPAIYNIYRNSIELTK